MNTPITIDIRCGNCNKKLSEITPPVTLMIQRIKCPRCGEIVETYVLKPTSKQTHKPKEKPRYNPVDETKVVEPDETKVKTNQPVTPNLEGGNY